MRDFMQRQQVPAHHILRAVADIDDGPQPDGSGAIEVLIDYGLERGVIDGTRPFNDYDCYCAQENLNEQAIALARTYAKPPEVFPQLVASDSFTGERLSTLITRTHGGVGHHVSSVGFARMAAIDWAGTLAVIEPCLDETDAGLRAERAVTIEFRISVAVVFVTAEGAINAMKVARRSPGDQPIWAEHRFQPPFVSAVTGSFTSFRACVDDVQRLLGRGDATRGLQTSRCTVENGATRIDQMRGLHGERRTHDLVTTPDLPRSRARLYLRCARHSIESRLVHDLSLALWLVHIERSTDR